MAKATYMYWQKRFNRENSDQDLEEKIPKIQEKNKNYGYRRISGELRKQGLVVNKKKVQRIMKKLGLQVTSFTRKSRKYNSYKGKVGKTVKNRIRRRFYTSIPHQKITTDTTEFKYYEVDKKGHMTMNKLYLDPFMDMYNGEIISFRISKIASFKNVADALEEAIERTADCPYRRTFHSDQGWAYQKKTYVQKLKKERIFQSMSRIGIIKIQKAGYKNNSLRKYSLAYLFFLSCNTSSFGYLFYLTFLDVVCHTYITCEMDKSNTTHVHIPGKKMHPT